MSILEESMANFWKLHLRFECFPPFPTMVRRRNENRTESERSHQIQQTCRWIHLYLEQNCEGFIPGIYSIHSLCLSFTAPAVQMEILLQEPLAQRTPWYRSLSMNHRPRQQSNLWHMWSKPFQSSAGTWGTCLHLSCRYHFPLHTAYIGRVHTGRRKSGRFVLRDKCYSHT